MIVRIEGCQQSKGSLPDGYLKFAFFVCLFGGTFYASCQSDLAVFGSGIYAFNVNQYHLQEDEIRVTGSGFLAGIGYYHRPKKMKLSAGVEVAYKQLYTTGSVGELTFTSKTSRLALLADVLYMLSDRWKAGIIILVENNKDFDQFIHYALDRVRYNAGLSTVVDVTDRLGIRLTIMRCLYPRENIYVITNPSEQVNLGLTFDLLKP